MSQLKEYHVKQVLLQILLLTTVFKAVLLLVSCSSHIA